MGNWKCNGMVRLCAFERCWFVCFANEVKCFDESFSRGIVVGAGFGSGSGERSSVDRNGLRRTVRTATVGRGCVVWVTSLEILLRRMRSRRSRGE